MLRPSIATRFIASPPIEAVFLPAELSDRDSLVRQREDRAGRRWRIMRHRRRQKDSVCRSGRSPKTPSPMNFSTSPLKRERRRQNGRTIVKPSDRRGRRGVLCGVPSEGSIRHRILRDKIASLVYWVSIASGPHQSVVFRLTCSFGILGKVAGMNFPIVCRPEVG